MPYDSIDSVPDYVPKGKRKQWMAIFNDTWGRTKGDKKEKENASFRAAGTVFKSLGSWVGFDLDGTLARDDNPNHLEEIGPPIPKTIAILKDLLAKGVPVRIVTARVSPTLPEPIPTTNMAMIKDWVMLNIGFDLTIQSDKSPNMICLYDDRVIAVERNTGELKGWSDDYPDLTNPMI